MYSSSPKWFFKNWKPLDQKIVPDLSKIGLEFKIIENIISSDKMHCYFQLSEFLIN